MSKMEIWDSCLLHTPSDKYGKQAIFVDFFKHSSDLYNTATGTAHCTRCGALLLLPKEYRWIQRLFAGLLMPISILIVVSASSSYVAIVTAFWLFLLGFLQRFLAPIVFTWCKWIAVDLDEISEEEFCVDQRKKQKQNLVLCLVLFAASLLLSAVILFLRYKL